MQTQCKRWRTGRGTPFPASQSLSLAHHCGSVRVQAAPERGENEALREAGKKKRLGEGVLGSREGCLGTTGIPGIIKKKEQNSLRW